MTPSVEKRYKDREWLRRQYVIEGKSMTELGEMCNVSSGTIHSWMEKFEIDTRSRSQACSDGNTDKLQDEDWMYQKYVEEGLPGTEIARLCDVDNMTVYSWLEKHGIDRRSPPETKLLGSLDKLNDEDWMRQKYISEGLDTRSIADLCGGVAKNTVLRWLEKHDIETRPGPLERSDADMERLYDEEYLKSRYDEGLSVAQIADELDAHTATVFRRFREYGIERRGHDECHPTGPDHPQFDPEYTEDYGPNWTEQRLKARIRDQCRCQYCAIHDGTHVEQYGRVNHVHHITPRSEYRDENGVLDYKRANDLGNLITLCETHHVMLEGMPIDNRHNYG